VESGGFRIRFRHISNSGRLRTTRISPGMVAAGVMSYGIFPSPETADKSILVSGDELKTRVVLVKSSPKGYSIATCRNLFITRQPTRIATIPVATATASVGRSPFRERP